MIDGPDGDGTLLPADDPLRQVMAEIDEEVRRRRAEVPVERERELDALFLEHAPVGARGGDVSDALRMVDQSAFIDPVVPVASQRPAGVAIKKSLRSMNLWYIGYVTHQVSKFGAAVSRALHAIDAQLADLRERMPPPSATRVLDAGSPDTWWVAAALDACRTTSGRVLHAACADGWLVKLLADAGVDAYGVDPRPGVVDDAELRGADLRQEGPLEHLRAVRGGSLGGAVLSGVVECMESTRRDALVDLVTDALGDSAVLVVHWLSPACFFADDAPPEADLAPGRPLRPRTWAHVLHGWDVDVVDGPTGSDYLVIARR